VAALVTPPVIAFAAVALSSTPVPLGSVMSASDALVYLLYGIPLFLLTEEAGWRGAVLPRLQFRSNALAASLLLGAIWSIWHLPILAIPEEGDYGLPPAGFAVLVIGTSVLVAALVNLARGSVLIAAIFHAVFDATYSYTGVVGGGSDTLFWTTTGITAGAAVAVIAFTRGRLFAPLNWPHG
jgi:membrane protease YdiL (CAAX protease family)